MNTRLNQRGNVTIIVMAVVLVVLVAFIGFKVLGKKDNSGQKAKNTSSTKTDKKTEDKTSDKQTGSNVAPSLNQIQSLAINSRNVQRKNDVSRIISVVNEYSYNNNGSMPTSYASGIFRGDNSDGQDSPAEVTGLGHYTSLTLETGEQAKVSSDVAVVVTGATCGSDGETILGSTRDFAVQYGLEQSDGSFKSACETN